MSAPNTSTAKARAPAKAAAKPAREKAPRTVKRSFVASSFAGVESVLQGGGVPLEPNLRSHMERGFGYDFHNVRVHCGPLAEKSAHDMGARAYAVGRHVVFDRGEYQPDDVAGQRLIAHELAHVVQQGSSDYRLDRPLEIQPGNSISEREADHAANAVLSGDTARVGRANIGSVQRLQRAEHGTYVSTVGERDYLDAGEQFYRHWGHPNVKRVANIKQVLDDLDTAKGTIEKFRIVSHGSSAGMELGLLPEIAADYLWAKDLGAHSTSAGFRAKFTDMKVVSESKVKEIYDALWKDNATNAMLIQLEGTKDVPKPETNLGILFRALVDARYLADVRDADDDSKRPKIPNVGAIQAFNGQRRNAYSKLVIDAKAKDKQADARKALTALEARMPKVMEAAKIDFARLSKQEAQTLADPFEEKGSLRKDIAKSVEEGTGSGAFLTKLKSVRGKIDSKTHIEIRGCNVGSKPETMDALRSFFGSPGALPALSAPDLYQYFYQLNVKSYSAAEQAALESVYNDAAVGVKPGFDDLTRIKAGEMVRVVLPAKIDDLAKRYGFNAADAIKFSPEIDNTSAEVPEGTVLWLIQRDKVPAGRHKDLKTFCEKYLGDAGKEAKVKAANPSITDTAHLSPGDQITIPKYLLNSRFASTADKKTDFVNAVRGGQAVAGLASELTVNVAAPGGGVTQERRTFSKPRPVLHIDDSKRNQALGNWLASQKFDPKGRSAKVLSELFGKSGRDFDTARAGTYIQFLSAGYPTPKDPIFPEDPRYDKHIIQRP